MPPHTPLPGPSPSIHPFQDLPPLHLSRITHTVLPGPNPHTYTPSRTQSLYKLPPGPHIYPFHDPIPPPHTPLPGPNPSIPPFQDLPCLRVLPLIDQQRMRPEDELDLTSASVRSGFRRSAASAPSSSSSPSPSSASSSASGVLGGRFRVHFRSGIVGRPGAFPVRRPRLGVAGSGSGAEVGAAVAVVFAAAERRVVRFGVQLADALRPDWMREVVGGVYANTLRADWMRGRGGRALRTCCALIGWESGRGVSTHAVP